MPAPDTYWYNLKKMHVVFAVSAIGLFAVTIAMLWKDHAREWPEYQQTFDRIEDARLTQQIGDEETAKYDQRVNDLKKRLAAAREAYEKRQEEYKQAHDGVSLDDEIDNLALQADKKAREVRNQRAERDKARADYDLAIRDERTKAAERLKDKYDNEQSQVDRLELELKQAEAALDAKKAERQQEMARVTALEAELKLAQADVVRLETTRNKIDPDNWFSAAKRDVMQWPIIDGFNSPRKINRIWLPDLKITLGMANTARFDHCKTCHQGIDRVEAGNIPTFPHGTEMVSTSHASKDQVEKWVDENKYPHPYSTHPNPDLYLSSTSPHPTQNFGCTICHDGQGFATSFGDASHTPNTPHEEEHWAEKYHYHSNHFWEYPMLPERFRESSCLRCHHEVTELETGPRFGDSAPKLVKGWHTIQTYGCFGCHEIHGSEGEKSLGPDLRLEPNYYGVAQHIAAAAKNKLNDSAGTESKAKAGEPKPVEDRLQEIVDLADRVAEAPENAEHERKTLQQMILADKGLENPLFSARIHILADGLKDIENPGLYRKVGPSLRYVKEKTTLGWLEYWTEMPKRFRPSTRMPQFFHNTNQEDKTAEAFQPVQIAAIGHYLLEKSQPIDLLSPPKDYQPNAERGKDFFSKKGCLACHSHKDFPDIHQDFGPNLDKVYAKLKPGEEGFRWLYSWIRDPHRYHKRTKMPHLFLDPYTPEGQKDLIDPAADIAAYLLQEREKDQPEYKPYDVAKASHEGQSTLDALVGMSLSQALGESQMKKFLETRIYPAPADDIKGDEIELAYQGQGRPSDQEWRAMKLNYVGRRTISQYGCYGCHDIPGFEAAKPIGVALQDWGRKDTSRLAFEHITEFLSHHNTPGTDTTLVEQVDQAMKRSNAGEFKSEEEQEEELSKAFYYDAILHHGRPGFLWQKLRQPRSYDYKKIETKRYDERLRMPKFPFDGDQIEAIATFVLGLTAEPPAEKYVFNPEGAVQARYEGEFLLHKYNCTGCHMVEPARNPPNGPAERGRPSLHLCRLCGDDPRADRGLVRPEPRKDSRRLALVLSQRHPAD